MKKLVKKLVVVSTLALTLVAFQVPQTKASAATTYQVQSGDTFWKIGNKFGVPVQSMLTANNRNSDRLLVGEQLTIPTTISNAEKDLLARLVHAEAKGESYAGKVAVATVVLNRVDSELFPNSVTAVINQIDQGYYAFTPVQNGTINQPADEESKRAVNEALAFRGMGNHSLYFYNPQTAKGDWIRSRAITVTIGNHVFAR